MQICFHQRVSQRPRLPNKRIPLDQLRFRRHQRPKAWQQPQTRAWLLRSCPNSARRSQARLARNWPVPKLQAHPRYRQPPTSNRHSIKRPLTQTRQNQIRDAQSLTYFRRSSTSLTPKESASQRTATTLRSSCQTAKAARRRSTIESCVSNTARKKSHWFRCLISNARKNV